MTNQGVEDVTDERIGTRVGEYLIDAVVGVGGMGTVYSATGADGARVALKVVKDRYAADETFRVRFEREAHIARTVRHPNLVPVLGTGEQDGIPYMAQELIEGRSLEVKLESDGCLDIAATVAICAGASAGLQALWDAGMVHRDVKPGNILLDTAGKIYVTDFGLAKNRLGSVLTLPGETVGSLDYMAPEQIRGDEVTGAADMYSLGCVLFECLQGRPPFGDRQGLRVLWAHLNDEPADPESVPPAFAAALKSALRKEPGDRPASGAEYTAELTRTAGLPLAALAG